MPAYDFRCEDCKRRIVLKYKTYAEYDHAVHTCPHCQSTHLTRLISRVALARSEESRFSSLEDEGALDDLATADPATMGRFMRRMSSEVGEDLGDEFNEVVGRLERGEAPESIEADLGSAGLDMPDLGGGGDLGGDIE